MSDKNLKLNKFELKFSKLTEIGDKNLKTDGNCVEIFKTNRNENSRYKSGRNLSRKL